MLTKINSDGTWSCQGVDFKELKGNSYGALCKLRDYEKSGFEPADLDRVKENITSVRQSMVISVSES